MPPAAARARYGLSGRAERLRIEGRDEQAEDKARKELLAPAATVSPRFEDAAPGLIVLDFSGPGDPHRSADELFRGAAKLGFEPRVGVSRKRGARMARLARGEQDAALAACRPPGRSRPWPRRPSRPSGAGCGSRCSKPISRVRKSWP